VGVIKKELKIIGGKGEKKVNVLFDTGASFSLIRRSVAEEIAPISPLGRSLRFLLGDGKKVLASREAVSIQIEMKRCLVTDHAIVMDSLAEDFILGASSMQFYQIKLDPEKEDFTINKERTKLQLV